MARRREVRAREARGPEGDHKLARFEELKSFDHGNGKVQADVFVVEGV